MVVLVAFTILLATVSAYVELAGASIVGGTEDIDFNDRKHASFVPQVAFNCGFENRYYTRTGKWKSEPKSKCTTSKMEILDYCRKVYPDLDVTNVVQVNHNTKIRNWCRDDQNKRRCKWQFWVNPYKCIVGEFESEALLVPEGCKFGHYDDRSMCEPVQHWNRTASTQCSKQSMNVASFSILEPCGLMVFSGVEYVCCPKKSRQIPKIEVSKAHALLKSEKIDSSGSKSKSSSSLDPQELHDVDDDAWWEPIDNVDKTKSSSDPDAKSTGDDDDEDEIDWESDGKDLDDDEYDEDDDDEWVREDDEEIDDDDEDERSSSNESDYDRFEDKDEKVVNNVQPKTVHLPRPDKVDPTKDGDVYFRIADPLNEHANFVAASKRLKKVHEERVSNIMREWSELETRYQEKRKNDPNGAARFRGEMSEKFRKTIDSLNDEHVKEKRRLEMVHQERIIASMNEQKREAIKTYRDALDITPQQESAIKRALERYVRLEEKDRTHALNRYHHLLLSDDDEAVKYRNEVLERLQDADLRINGTIDMLRGSTDLEQHIKPVIYEYWQVYRRDNAPEFIPDNLLWIGSSANFEKVVELYEREAAKEQPAEESILPKKVAVPLKKADNAGPDDVFDRVDVAVHSESLPSESDSKYEAEARRDALSHEYAGDTLMVHDQSSKLVGGSGAFSPLFIALSVIGTALVVSMLLGIVVIRRRNSRGRYIEVDACTPEERHVAAMQVNGYENPTYKHFDANA